MSFRPQMGKGSLSGLEFRVISREISAALTGSYVSNIYSIGETQLLRMRKPSKDAHSEAEEISMVLSPAFGAWITGEPARGETTEFTTALRSSLLRAKLFSASQVDLDRVLVLRFSGKGESGDLGLVLELMPPGNIILTEVGKVTVALHEVKTGERRISKGRLYSPPAQARASLETLTRSDLVDSLSREATLGRALGRGLSIPRRYVDEILARSSLRQDESSQASEGLTDKLMATIMGLLEEVAERPWPCIVSTGDGRAEVMVIRPTTYEVLDSAESISPLLDRLLTSDVISSEQQGVSHSKETPGDATQRRAAEYSATISGLEKKRDAVANRAEELRKLALAVGRAPSAEVAVKLAEDSNILPRDLLASVDSLGKKGQASVSSAIFDKAKGAEREVHDVESAISLLQAKLKKVAEKKDTAKTRTTLLSNAKKDWYEKFRWFFTTGGKLAVGGRDAQSNTNLLRRHLEKGDTVYHADLFGSPFFVLKRGSEQTEEEIRQVAKATVIFSSAWKTGLASADAYWVAPDQVSSAGPSGEFLAHGSFAIKGKKNFVRKNPVEVAVGVDDGGRIVSGPEDSIIRVASAYVSVVPSRDKSSDTAKKILHELKAGAGSKTTAGVDDVLRMLPAGGGKVVRTRALKVPSSTPPSGGRTSRS